jgi:hypothetical protein
VLLGFRHRNFDESHDVGFSERLGRRNPRLDFVDVHAGYDGNRRVRRRRSNV